MEAFSESILIWSLVILLTAGTVAFYLRRRRRESLIIDEKLTMARSQGTHEPVSLHPYVDPSACIGTGACVSACPEKDILGVRNGKAVLINASRCIGHGACFHACPTEAITLRIGTAKRGVDLPHLGSNFETNVPGIFIAGELGGMGLIKNATEQGRQAVENIAASLKPGHPASSDLIIIGAGPAGVTASLAARKLGLNALLLEQDTLGGAVFSYPRQKVVMTSPMNIPLHGKVKLYQTSKSELLELWTGLLRKNRIELRENCKVESLSIADGVITVRSADGGNFTAARILLAIGRRGTPRKLNVPGETLEKVAYQLADAEEISGKKILIVGGGDSAVESALLLMEKNIVTISYRGVSFSRIKPGNQALVESAIRDKRIEFIPGSNVTSIGNDKVILSAGEGTGVITIPNDLVYIFAGGELPVQFLEKSGIKITRKFGETMLKH